MDKVLALDIGGTKIAAGLVRKGSVTERHTFETPRSAGADGWMDALDEAVAPWRGRYRAVGAALTGLVEEGLWSALNPETLPVPAGFPIEREVERRLGRPARAWNDAHAAAWGEYRAGAGRNCGERTMVFVTISTGVGGGIVAGGKLLGGLAGHFGQWRGHADVHGRPAETAIAGRWIAERAREVGCAADSRGVFAAREAGESWAVGIVDESARRAASLLLNIHLALDPAVVVVGGGIGLAPGYLDAVAAALGELPSRLRPHLAPASLGADAGLIGVADLVCETHSTVERA